MKKSAFLLMFFLVTIFSGFAQTADEVAVETLTLKKGNIPPAVLKTADELFKGSTQVKWGVFPYELRDYGWVINKDYDQPIDHYEVYMKASDGSDVYAIFESTGELIRSRLVNKTASLPAPILAAIAKTEYKDWKVAGGTEVIKSTQKKVVEHYAVNVTNGNQKKTLYYTTRGEMLVNK